MKKLLFAFAFLITSLSIYAQKPFQSNDKLANLGMGIGICGNTDKMSPMFTQSLSFEMGIANLGRKGTLGIGFTLANSCGNFDKTTIMGTYDYDYSIIKYVYRQLSTGAWRTGTSYETAHRSGSGTADADFLYENPMLLVNTTYHHAFSKKFEGYATLGLGLGAFKTVYSNLHNYKGFEYKNHKANIDHSYHRYQVDYEYCFDDSDHAEFAGSSAQAYFAFTACLGLRYYFNEHFAGYTELGLNAANIKKSFGNYNLFTVGCSYKF